jgi:hypothetical protein
MPHSAHPSHVPRQSQRWNDKVGMYGFTCRWKMKVKN